MFDSSCTLFAALVSAHIEFSPCAENNLRQCRRGYHADREPRLRRMGPRTPNSNNAPWNLGLLSSDGMRWMSRGMRREFLPFVSVCCLSDNKYYLWLKNVGIHQDNN